MLKKLVHIFFLSFCLLALSVSVQAQCSICTKTAQQLGEKPAKGLNAGIIYLMLTPFAIVGFIGYRWWKKNKNV
jgi:TRAP-type C4-dicarboxylate transport system permease small subunit